MDVEIVFEYYSPKGELRATLSAPFLIEADPETPLVRCPIPGKGDRISGRDIDGNLFSGIVDSCHYDYSTAETANQITITITAIEDEAASQTPDSTAP